MFTVCKIRYVGSELMWIRICLVFGGGACIYFLLGWGLGVSSSFSSSSSQTPINIEQRSSSE